MGALSEAQLVQKLKGGVYDRVYYFYGKDISTIQSVGKRLAAKLVDKGSEAMNLHRFQGDSLDLGQLSDALEQLPMFGGHVCVTINDLNGESLNAEDMKTLGAMISDLPESTTLIITITGFDPCGGKRNLTAKNKKLADWAVKYGVCCEFGEKSPQDLAKNIMAKAAKMGCEIQKNDAQYLAVRCGCDQLLLAGELEKLLAYKNSGPISRADIDLLVSGQLDSNAFDLAKSAALFDSSRAIKLLDELFYQRLEPVVIVHALSMAFLDLYRARLGMGKGLGSKEVAEAFKYPANRAFAVTNAFRDAGKISLNQLRFCLEQLAQTDCDLKSTRTEGRILLEEAIVAMCARRRNETLGG